MYYGHSEEQQAHVHHFVQGRVGARRVDEGAEDLRGYQLQAVARKQQKGQRADEATVGQQVARARDSVRKESVDNEQPEMEHAQPGAARALRAGRQVWLL
jgi:hypothetical protein